MPRALTAFAVTVVAFAAIAWAHTDPTEITLVATPKAAAEADSGAATGPPPAAVTAIIFKTSCGRCHGSDRPAVGLSLKREDFAAATIDVPSKEVPELKLVDTKNPEKSYLLMKIRGDEGIIGERMPIGSKALADEGIAAIEAWVREVSAAAADTTEASEAGAPATEEEPETAPAPEAERETEAPAAPETAEEPEAPADTEAEPAPEGAQ
jgi:mono/diheme cytochrome c family protein